MLGWESLHLQDATSTSSVSCAELDKKTNLAGGLLSPPLTRWDWRSERAEKTMALSINGHRYV